MAAASSTTSSLQGAILGMGNPLLDISADVDQKMLDKYEVKLNNAILAEDKHLPMYEDLKQNFQASYIAGGATQNSMRVAQWMLQTPGVTNFIGCVGRDFYAETMTKAATEDGVTLHYLVDEKAQTGTCACLIMNNERSLVANLSAANNYKLTHLTSDAIRPVWTNARFFYISGFFLTVSPPSIMHIAEHAHATGKTFMMNLSAPFICQFFADPLLAAMPYVDVIFGNESEAKAFGEKQAYPDCSPQAVALKIAGLEKKNAAKPRIVIITQGADPTVVVQDGKVTLVPTDAIPKSEIVDSNGAGDAFVGGWLSQFVQDKSMFESVKAGQYAAGVVLRASGTVLPAKPSFTAPIASS